MPKRAIIIHGWDGTPNYGWFPWLNNELKSRGFEVYVPQMPEADVPKIELWVPKLAEVVGTPNADTYLIGHSMGCQTILRYLQTIDVKIGGIVLVAGFFDVTLPNEPENKEIFEPWKTIPINFERVKQNMGKGVALFSDNDHYVPLSNVKLFEDRFGMRTVVMKDMKHFGNSFKKLPIVIQEIDRMTEKN